MKIWKLMYLMPIVAIATWLSSCGEDEKDKPKTLAVVETMPVTEFTTTTADVEGEITDDGNLEITESGFVYSNIVSTPTIADSKVTVEAVDGVLSTTLTELASGTLYRVRAYAVNSKGTAYGEVEIFTTGNAAPTASALSITGDVEANKTITASYTYADAEGDGQGTSTFKWYRATSATGTGEAVIDGATSNTYLIKAEDEGKFIKFSVTPKATSGNLTGTEVSSTYVGAVGEATTVTFIYNGNTVTYGIINSPTTGRKWLDRNLGAAAAPASIDNYQNFGDLFQWGRLDDGHQVVDRTGPTDADVTGVNGYTQFGEPPNYSFSATDNPGTSQFLSIPDSEFADWRMPSNNNLWQGVDGINNPCPEGWRIPTSEEWTAEGITSLTDGFSKLKLTKTGVRVWNDNGLAGAPFYQHQISGNFWSASPDATIPQMSGQIRITDTFTIQTAPRAFGLACRCIKD